MKTLKSLLIIFLCLLSSCGDTSTRYEYLSSMLMPEGTQNYWVYRDSFFTNQDTLSQFYSDTIKVVNSFLKSNRFYYQLNKSSDSSEKVINIFSDGLIKNQTDGLSLFENNSTDLKLKLFLKYPVNSNETYVSGIYKVTTDNSNYKTYIQNDRNIYYCKKYKLEYELNGEFIKREMYFKDNVGLICEYDSVSNLGFNGPYYLCSKRELIYYKVFLPMPD